MFSQTWLKFYDIVVKRAFYVSSGVHRGKSFLLQKTSNFFSTSVKTVGDTGYENLNSSIPIFLARPAKPAKFTSELEKSLYFYKIILLAFTCRTCGLHPFLVFDYLQTPHKSDCILNYCFLKRSYFFWGNFTGQLYWTLLVKKSFTDFRPASLLQHFLLQIKMHHRTWNN